MFNVYHVGLRQAPRRDSALARTTNRSEFGSIYANRPLPNAWCRCSAAARQSPTLQACTSFSDLNCGGSATKGHRGCAHSQERRLARGPRLAASRQQSARRSCHGSRERLGLRGPDRGRSTRADATCNEAATVYFLGLAFLIDSEKCKNTDR